MTGIHINTFVSFIERLISEGELAFCRDETAGLDRGNMILLRKL